MKYPGPFEHERQYLTDVCIMQVAIFKKEQANKQWLFQELS